MEIKRIGKELKVSLQDATDAIKTKAKEVDLSEMKDVGSKATEQLQGLFKKIEKKRESEDVKAEDTSPDESTDKNSIKGVSVRNAMKIIYYLMAADGEIFHGEEEKFNEIGVTFDSDFMEVKNNIVKECKEYIAKSVDSEDYNDVLREGIAEALVANQEENEALISSKLLVWDLLSIVYSDESYDEAERRLLKYIVRKCNINKANFLEMESSMLTLLDLEKELEWIKSTNKPYLTIEALVNEINNRKEVVYQSVLDLITL